MRERGCDWVLCSDEDDTAELLRELQKIKKERAEEQARKVNKLVDTLIQTNVLEFIVTWY